MTHNQADALIVRVANADMSALEELYNALAKQVYAYSLSISRNRQTAEDVMQDTFVKVYAYSKNFKPKNLGIAWIMRIARNLTLDAISDKGKAAEMLDDNIVAGASTEETAVANELFRSALNSLADSEREVFVLHAVSGLRLEEIARVLDQPTGTIKWRHAQAVKKIKQFMGTEVQQ